MFHPHIQRVIVLAAGILFLAYAINTDTEEATAKRKDGADGNPDDGSTDESPPESPGEISNVVDAASEAGQFGTWSLAVKQAGLTATLESAGPFTLFAPTDEAFGKLGEALDELLADKQALRRAIESHIVDGNLTSADLAAGTSLTTLAGTTLTISATDGIVIGECRVVDADLTASNGVIHGIDTVLPADTETA